MSNKKPRYENSDRNRVTPRQSFLEALKAQEELRAVPSWRAEKNYYLLSTINGVINSINDPCTDNIEHLDKKKPIPAFGSLGCFASWLEKCNPKAVKEFFIYILRACFTEEFFTYSDFYKGLGLYMANNDCLQCKQKPEELEEYLRTFAEDPINIFFREHGASATVTPEEAIAQIVEDTNEIFSNLENPLEK